MVEALLALAVIGVSLTVLLRTVLLGLELGYQARELGRGLCLAREQASLYRAGRRDAAADDESQTDEETPTTTVFRHETRLASDYVGLQEVEVKITWGGPDADREELLLYLYIYEQEKLRNG